jgi:hypothetical protein
MSMIKSIITVISLVLFACTNEGADRNMDSQETVLDISGDWSLIKISEETWSDTILCDSREIERNESMRIKNSKLHFYDYPYMKKFESNFILNDSIIFFNNLNQVVENRIFHLSDDSLILLQQYHPRNHFYDPCGETITLENKFYIYKRTTLNTDTLYTLDTKRINTDLIKKNWTYDLTSLNLRFHGRFEKMLISSMTDPKDTSIIKLGVSIDEFIDFEPKKYLNLMDTNSYKINGEILTIVKSKDIYKIEIISESSLLLTPLSICECDTLMLLYQSLN